MARTDVTFYPNVHYGTFKRNKLDLLLPIGGPPTGLVVYFHGGSFLRGDKRSIYSRYDWQPFIERLLDKRIAIATVNYRYMDDVVSPGALTSIDDGILALQFLRYNQDRLNLNGDIIVAGGSAGSSIALTIALSDDMADSQSDDPAERMSTRVLGAYGFVPQASWDVTDWPDDVFSAYASEGFSSENVHEILTEDFVLQLLGLETIDELESDDALASRARLDLLSLLSADDPEIYVKSPLEDGLPGDFDQLVHHPKHVQALVAKGEETGAPIRGLTTMSDTNTTGGLAWQDWIIGKLTN